MEPWRCRACRSGMCVDPRLGVRDHRQARAMCRHRGRSGCAGSLARKLRVALYRPKDTGESVATVESREVPAGGFLNQSPEGAING